MARKTEVFVIEDEGRDTGKHFLLTEMDADKAEKWAARALLALMKSGVEVPEDVAGAGLAGVAQMGLKALTGISWELAEPLLDEMFRCVQKIEDPERPFPRALLPGDIEEVRTRLKLRQRILELHMGFSLAAALSTSASAVAGDKKASRTTRTSRA